MATQRESGSQHHHSYFLSKTPWSGLLEGTRGLTDVGFTTRCSAERDLPFHGMADVGVSECRAGRSDCRSTDEPQKMQIHLGHCKLRVLRSWPIEMILLSLSAKRSQDETASVDKTLGTGILGKIFGFSRTRDDECSATPYSGGIRMGRILACMRIEGDVMSMEQTGLRRTIEIVLGDVE